MSDKKVVSTHVIKCQKMHEALVVVYEDGDVEVRCEARCEYCGYGRVVRSCASAGKVGWWPRWLVWLISW